jgi:quercetin dioxygenase-like cupin family protein
MNTPTKVRNLTLSTILLLILASSILLSAEKEGETANQSHKFFAFEDAEYHTSPDKRIGAKILVDPAKVGPSISSMVHLTYLPGAHIKSHRHVFVTEIVHVLEGNLTLRIGDEVKVMGPNSTAWIPPKAFHEYLNDSTDVVKFLQHFSPSGPEQEYRQWDKASAQEAAKEVQKKEEEKTTNIVTPPLPPVPGSPKPMLGDVKETVTDENPAPVETLPDLKLKSEQGK